MTHNVSSTGALLGTMRPLSIGDVAELSFELGSSEPGSVTADVVRLELSPASEGGLWRYLVAVRFKRPLPASLLTDVASDTTYVPRTR